MEYTQDLINCQREDLLMKLKNQISPKRYEHVLGVEETSLKLAQRYNVEREKASIAALLHDYAKEMDHEQMLNLACKYWDEPMLLNASGEIWHGFAAAQIAKDEFHVTDKSILTAIAGHTIGWFEMDDLFKVLYLADYTESGRDFPGVDKARELSKRNLDEAVTFKMTQTLKYLLDERQGIFIPTVDIYNQWVKQN
ncbi:bis(5'-nucleosyl)-tetraphosphatase (symmetrical) YqeK [Fundicoccus culcitae]|uniref:bis(5'-nucleosyl)-tetraphosphatase (symmetrical) n=1 Tax=Fundicoccus culcitae TaxID=2969821 RepID=A0ABY5P751_9LACT|nr:bis(5'-nucleosyl)-tetraphosphatase (symmetrical) YqeK [Fundicoccus culcitae]UUX34200.1 bis(5'-nucleosyl)-tetraphosphatase (symmetrical) YqeK [Fundicoccus culcitae]